MTRFMSVFFGLIAGSVLLGCGDRPTDVPTLGAVQGTVTLDGAPLSGAIVLFEPKATGAGSSGATKEDGKYTLVYSATENGAVPGEHTVRITRQEMDMGPETLPAVYNVRSTLTATVVAGKNELNFALESKPKKK
ncbi:carboxypeptidase-like regulatory domain-containing protein [Planctomicrobium sp. SH527]|uniref:carboxypeptidase-like regulatory domain-containing protein n=1 Tax=Planctomicrobium sp. SH527 TaxID=3448123 RepID=UPI003F5C0168